MDRFRLPETEIELLSFVGMLELSMLLLFSVIHEVGFANFSCFVLLEEIVKELRKTRLFKYILFKHKWSCKQNDIYTVKLYVKKRRKLYL